MQIEAFVSPSVPEALRADAAQPALDAARVRGRSAATRSWSITTTPSRSARRPTRAEQQFGITAAAGRRRAPAARSAEDEIFLGVAFTCGLEKVVMPFLDRGIPVEYELVRSICTVSQQKRKRIGVLTTDAKLFGGFDMQTMSPAPQRADDRRVGEAIRRGAGRRRPVRSPRSTTCCWPCSPRRWGRSR